MGAQESKIEQEMKDKVIVITYKLMSHLPNMIKEHNQIVSELKKWDYGMLLPLLTI